MKVMGIDEAGRGCVLGPLVICGLVYNEKELSHLEEIGVKDSKKLTKKKRESLFNQIKDKTHSHLLKKISAKEIDNRETKDLSLNDLEIINMAALINELSPDIVYIDAIQQNVETFVIKLKKYLKKAPKIVAKNKADTLFPIVSAASILAKVTRDQEIDKIKEKFGPVGSGYPSDPYTKKWLHSYFDTHNSLPDIVRHSWFTIQELLSKKKQTSLDSF